MKILLVEPEISPYDIPTGLFGLPPLHHLERLASMLTPHHDVDILDMRIEETLQASLDAFKPDLVGVSCVVANSHLAKKVLTVVKQHNPETYTVIGGHHPSLMPEDCYESYIDFIVIGEGEMTLQELALVCENGNRFDTVNGIVYQNKNGEFKKNPLRPLANLDDLPLPARYLTEKYRAKKLYYRASWRPTDSIISSRGCPFKCKFCGLWKINQGQYRSRKSELVVDELERISDPYVCFVDDNSLDHYQNASKTADLILDRGFKKTYELYGRANTIVQHPDLIEKWKKAGMDLLLIGLESLDQDELKDMNKHISVATNQKAIEICHANDIEIVSYFVINPQFDKDDFKRLKAYVQENRLTHPVYTILSPFPGTDLYFEVKDKLITQRKDIIDFYHTVLPTKLDMEEFYNEFIGLYQSAYPIKEFLMKLLGNKAMFSPTMFLNMRKMNKKLNCLFQHHHPG